LHKSVKKNVAAQHQRGRSMLAFGICPRLACYAGLGVPSFAAPFGEGNFAPRFDASPASLPGFARERFERRRGTWRFRMTLAAALPRLRTPFERKVVEQAMRDRAPTY
jgi:hypothetical protein